MGKSAFWLFQQKVWADGKLLGNVTMAVWPGFIIESKRPLWLVESGTPLGGMQPPWAPHATQYVLRMDFCTFLQNSKWPKTGFRLSKGRKKPACAVSFLFCKCQAVLTKALSCFPNDFHLSWEGGSYTGATGGRAVLKSKWKSLYSTKKTNKSPPFSATYDPIS